MKQLDLKAVWLFFTTQLISWGFFALIVASFLDLSLGSEVDELGYETLSINWGYVALVIIVATVLAFIFSKLTYRYYRYEMGDIVFKKEHGIIWKKYVSIPYNRIQNVDIHRGILARLLGLSDLQIQTAGGITAGSYGALSEGRLVGISREEAEILRDQLIQKARTSRGQGL